MRGGSEFIAEIPEENAVLKTYKLETGQEVIVVIGLNKVRLFDSNGPITGQTNLLANPTFSDGVSPWDYVFLEPLPPDSSLIVLTPGIGFTASASANYRAQCWQDITFPDLSASYRVTCKVTIQATTPGKIPSGEYFVRFKNSSLDIVDDFTMTDTLGQPGLELFIDETIDASDYLNGFTRFEIGVENQEEASNQRITALFSEIQIIKVGSSPTVIEEDTPEDWRDKLPLIKTCQDTADGRMFFTCLNGPMYTLQKIADSWSFTEFSPLALVNEKPAACAIHQGRLWLGGSQDFRSRLWASEVWNYANFTIPAPVPNEPINAADPLQFDLSIDGRISWLDSLKLLLIGTDRGIAIGRSQGPSISSSDFDFPTEQKWAAAPIQPTQYGSDVFFATIDKRRIRSLYDGGDRRKSYETKDITIDAEHLAKLSIVELAYQELPDYHLSALLDNGLIITSTYYPDGEVNAWYRYSTYSRINSMTTTADISGVSLWVLVGEQEAGKFNLEVKKPDNIAGYNLDSHVIGFSDPTGLITGLDHLDGKECSVVKINDNGFTILQNRIPLAGEIQVESIGFDSQLIIGLPYTATMRTLDTEGSNNMGTALVQQRRFSEVFLRLYDSAVPKINGERPAIRTAETNMNDSQPLFTGDTKLHVSKWNNGVIEITQDLPLPTKISAIFGKVKGSST